MQKLTKAKEIRDDLDRLVSDNKHLIGDDLNLAKRYREQIRLSLGFGTQELSSFQRVQIRKFAFALRDINFRDLLYKKLSVYIALRDKYVEVLKAGNIDADYRSLLSNQLADTCSEIRSILIQKEIPSVLEALLPSLPRQETLEELKFIEDFGGVPLNPYYLANQISFVDYQGQQVLADYSYDEQEHNALAEEFNELTEDGTYNAHADVQLQSTDSWLQLQKLSHPKFVIEIEDGATYPQLLEFIKNKKLQIEKKLGKSSPRLSEDFSIKQKAIVLKNQKCKMPVIINTIKSTYALELTEEQVSDLIRK